jgi:hypothetical protein
MNTVVEPNDVTKEAIKEARAGKFAGTIHTESMEALIKSSSGFDENRDVIEVLRIGSHSELFK